ncbi:MAG: hypothetical protein ACKV2U_01890 [Bryobacteraceae bacterium]
MNENFRNRVESFGNITVKTIRVRLEVFFEISRFLFGSGSHFAVVKEPCERRALFGTAPVVAAAVIKFACRGVSGVKSANRSASSKYSLARVIYRFSVGIMPTQVH